MKYYTIGEIHRLGLLKNSNGDPYKHKATISNIVNRLPNKTKKTAWGIAKTISQAQISKWNKKWL